MTTKGRFFQTKEFPVPTLDDIYDAITPEYEEEEEEEEFPEIENQISETEADNLGPTSLSSNSQ